VTYADEKMTRAQELCRSSSLKYGVEHVDEFITGDISNEFLQVFNYEILSQPRGCGYWLWKPYFIYRSMWHCKDDDILIYADAGVEFIAPVQEIISRMEQDIFFFSNGWPHYDWCKRKVLEAIIPDLYKENHPERKYMPQVQASVIFFKVNQQTRDFVKEWLLWCQMPGFIDDSPSKEGESEQAGFQEHRHDQSILTCLAYKYGHRQHWWPTQYSMHLVRSEKDSYPCMFNHHRKRNDEW
jgi:hypothetical protein